MTTANSGLVLSGDHEDLRRSLRSFLQTASSEAAVRRVMETDEGVDPAVWSRLAEQLGVTALLVPEEHDGAGFGFVEVGVALEEAGRALLVAPLLSTLLGTAAIVKSGDAAAQARWLPGIAAGELTATVALPPVGLGPVDGVTVTADGELSGEVPYVLDGHTADVLVVPAQGPDGLGLYLVEGTAVGLQRTALQTVDLTRRLATVAFDGTPATRLAGDGAALLQHVRHAAAILLAAEQVGAAERVLEITVDYAKTRNQFGRAIGSFQAVKHRCADMLVDVESARSALYSALWCLATDSPELPLAAATAKAFCSDAFLATSAESIQVHGGIGFTWEHPVHLYFKRAKASQILFGDPAHHRTELAGHLGY
ncbi:MAG: putative acyl-CoA dehydrogenase [Frankiales bacterium]|nr:putative acyl-CoA dehydrogenase [Frankiales bacterium]